MNDYGEILKLPYKINDIYEPLKKIFKYDRLNGITLKELDEQNKTFDLIYHKFLFKSKINIKLIEIKKGVTELSIYAETNLPLDFNSNRKVVKKLVNVIFKELKECVKTGNDEDFSVSIIKKKNRFKSFFNFIVVAFLAFLVFYYIFISIDSVASSSGDNNNDWVFIVAAIFFGMIYTIIYKIVHMIKRKRYSKKRIIKIKRMLYHLIEEEDVKKNINSNSSNKEIIKKIGIIPDKIKPYIDKGISYVKKTKQEKPKIFWTFIISIGLIVSWIIIGPIFGPKTLEGEYVQQMENLSNKYNGWAVSIRFSNGKFYPHESQVGYDYKIKGNKIYIIMNGKEAYSDFKVKNKNTLIVGDGIIDEVCYGNLCGPNTDGIYIKQ